MRARCIGLAVLWLALAPSGLAAPSQPAPPLELPALGWTCPMHREVFQHDEGRCPICGMALVRTRLEQAWTCPFHAAILKEAPGTCPVDGRALMPVTVEVAWRCPVHAEVTALEPGYCPVGGEPLVQGRTVRPHEDHTPKHGGIFFMAPDNWHHLEGVYPEPGVFRIYLYDNYSRPLPATAASGRIVLKEEAVAGGAPRELVTVPLTPSPDGQYLEARLSPLALPAEIIAKLTFPTSRPGTAPTEEARFDFTFPTFSTEPAPSSVTASGEPALVAPTTPAGGFVPLAVTVPERPEAIARAIAARDEVIADLVRRGGFGQVFAPALEAKELALALDGRLDELPELDRPAVRFAIKQLVRAAWLLDWYGDLGNRDEVSEAYRLFAEAAGAIRRAYRVP